MTAATRFYDFSYATNTECREEVRQELWSAHLKSPPCLVGGVAKRGGAG